MDVGAWFSILGSGVHVCVGFRIAVLGVWV